MLYMQFLALCAKEKKKGVLKMNFKMFFKMFKCQAFIENKNLFLIDLPG